MNSDDENKSSKKEIIQGEFNFQRAYILVSIFLLIAFGLSVYAIVASKKKLDTVKDTVENNTVINNTVEETNNTIVNNTVVNNTVDNTNNNNDEKDTDYSYLNTNYYQKNGKKITIDTESIKNSVSSGMTSNDIQNFDLSFLQLEQNYKNIVYSPLSIKYGLSMLNSGANNETKSQITSILGTYNINKYTNSQNMSIANALFIKDTYKDSIKEDYINTLSNKFDASIIFDSFSSADTVNKWISSRTYNLINNMLNDVSDTDYLLVNTLAIDMEWTDKISDRRIDTQFKHIKYNKVLDVVGGTRGYDSLKFSGVDYDVKSIKILTVANRYDIVTDLGEDNIRKTVTNDYINWLAKGECGSTPNTNPDMNEVNETIDKYMEEIKSNYPYLKSSTDYYFYIDDDVKVFAKDLKTYNNVTLEYVSIMPTNEDLSDYIKNINSSKINDLISKLKDVKSINSFENGYITQVEGYIPTFKFSYDLNLMSDLKSIGITDVFDYSKADLSNLTTSKSYINKALHSTNIELSNEGIKAASAITLGGYGAEDCKWDYYYDVPVKKIDITFDKPFIYLIRNKETGEVWFVGSVYNPNKITTDDISGVY